jgi:hypothetical protein
MARFDDPRRVLVWGLVAIALAVAAALGVTLVRTTAGLPGALGRSAPPQVSHETVMERLRDVAKLVASEMTLRDVVIYQQTRFRSTKRAMLVVTGRVSAGINLRSAAVEIDSAGRRIIVALPPAHITAVEVLNVTTYDESSGLLNPFTPDDRDAIQQRIRAQLNSAARQSGILEHADQSAAKTLEELLKVEGYVVEIRRPLQLERPTG